MGVFVGDTEMFEMRRPLFVYVNIALNLWTDQFGWIWFEKWYRVTKESTYWYRKVVAVHYFVNWYNHVTKMEPVRTISINCMMAYTNVNDCFLLKQ